MLTTDCFALLSESIKSQGLLELAVLQAELLELLLERTVCRGVFGEEVHLLLLELEKLGLQLQLTLLPDGVLFLLLLCLLFLELLLELPLLFLVVEQLELHHLQPIALLL